MLTSRFLTIATFLCGAAMPATSLASEKYALLVGVGDYDNPKIEALRAPLNDVSIMAGVSQRLGVKARNISILTTATNPELTLLQSSGKPTRAAILNGLSALADRVQSGDQALVYISSHGVQQPDQPEGENGHDEADGLDEVMLPADTVAYDSEMGTVTNAITDDELGVHVERMRAKGATVWLIVDACHSGTALRSSGAASPYRQVKYMDPDVLGIPSPAIRPTAAPTPTLDIDESSLGNVVAFYAVQPGLRALADRWRQGDDYSPYDVSLMTFALAQATQSGQISSYRDLAQRLTGIYRQQSDIGDIYPQFEGEFNRPIMGDGVVEPKSWGVALRDGNVLELQGGQIDAVNEGALLRVTNLRNPEQKGLFRVSSATATTAVLAPVGGYDPAPLVADTGRQLRAEMVSSAIGLGVKVRVEGQDSPHFAMATGIARDLAGQRGQGIAIVAPGERADLVVRAGADRIWLARGEVDPARFDPQDRSQPPYILCTGMPNCREESRKALALLARGRRMEGILAASTSVDVASHMRVETMIRRSDAHDGTATCADFTPPADGESFGPIGPDPLSPAGTGMGNCDQIWLRVTYTGTQALDVTPIYMAVDGSIGIMSGDTRRDEDMRIMPGETRQFFARIRTTSRSGASYPVGQESAMLIAVEQPASVPPRTYRWLATPGQATLRAAESPDPLAVALAAAETPGALRATAGSAGGQSTVIQIPLDVRAR